MRLVFCFLPGLRRVGVRALAMPIYLPFPLVPAKAFLYGGGHAQQAASSRLMPGKARCARLPYHSGSDLEVFSPWLPHAHSRRIREVRNTFSRPSRLLESMPL